jgi:iron complex transport system permease protein
VSAIRTPERVGSALRPLRTADERLSTRLHVRSLVVCAVLLVLVTAVSVLLLTVGDRFIGLPTVLATIFGDGRGGATFVVNQLRLPRLLTALLVGVALGVSGAILQRLTRNPLGSPDVVGLTVGAATGALVVILLIGGSMLPVAIGSLVGGLAASAVVYLLSYRRGVQSFRLILIGLGVGAVLESVNSYLVVTADLEAARAAQVWLTGSLNNRGWEHVVAMAVALLVLLPPAVLLGRRLPMLDLGDDAAAALGLRVERARLALVLVSVGLASAATAAAGPIAFVALAAPQVAARLTRSPGPGLVAAGLTGALLLTASDFVAQRALGSVQLPVGVATGLVGGGYLTWLLVREFRRQVG